MGRRAQLSIILDGRARALRANPLVAFGMISSSVCFQVDDVSSLRVNIWINRDLSLFELSKAEKDQHGEPKVLCNNCDSNKPAKSMCFDCERFVCDFCITMHGRMEALKDHQIKTLEEITATVRPVMNKPKSCDKHFGEKLKLFCERCKVLVCRDCILIDHKDHEYSFIEDVVEKYKDKLERKSQEVKGIRQNVEDALNKVKEMEKRVEKISEDVEKEIDVIIDAKIQALEIKRNALKQELRNSKTLKMKRLSAQEDGLQMHSTAIKSAVDFTKNLLKNGTASDILTMMEQLTSRMSKLCKKDIDDKVDREDEVKVQVDENKPFGDPYFLRLVDKGAPDPNCCKLFSRHAKETILEVRNTVGDLVSVKQSRLGTNCPFDSPVVITSYRDLWKMSWSLFLSVKPSDTADSAVHRIKGVTLRKPETSSTPSRGQIESGSLEILIDGQPIKGSPFKVWKN